MAADWRDGHPPLQHPGRRFPDTERVVMPETEVKWVRRTRRNVVDPRAVRRLLSFGAGALGLLDMASCAQWQPIEWSRRSQLVLSLEQDIRRGRIYLREDSPLPTEMSHMEYSAIYAREYRRAVRAPNEAPRPRPVAPAR